MRPSEQPPGPAARLLRGAGLVARVRPWPHTPTLAHLVTLDQQLPLPSAVLRSWLNDLVREGYTHVRTGALAPSHRSPYDALGFVVAQQLTLLHLDLRSPIARRSRAAGRATTVALRRHHVVELPLLARVDASAFPPGWGLDASGLLEAARATPSSRIRVATAGGQVVGLAISGRSGSASFLQRLAVQPSYQRSGAGTALVGDAVSWARHWRSRAMAVNTQHDNEPALALYRRLGFEPSPTPLVVLERTLSGEL